MLTRKCTQAVAFVNDILNHPEKANPYALCEVLGIEIISDKPILQDGYLVCCDGIKLIFISPKITNCHRRKFIIAHEVGHFLMHRDGLFCCNNIKDYGSAVVNSSVQENEANSFASEFLLPIDELKKMLPHGPVSFSTIMEIADRFDVSITHAAMQAVRSSNAENEILLCYDGRRLKWYATANTGVRYSRIPQYCPVDSFNSPSDSDITGPWDSLYSGSVHQEIFHTYANQYLILLSQRE